MMKITRNETTVGAFMLVALAGLVVFLVAKAGQAGWLRGTKRFSIRTADGRNIKEQAPVRMHGIQVGVVESIDMDADSMVIVRFRVDPPFSATIRKDAEATIIEPPLLGLTYLDLFPGSRTEEEAPRAMEIQARYQPTLVATIEQSVGKVESIMKKVDTALERANESLGAIAKITNQIADGDGTVSRLIKDQQLANDVKKIVAQAAVVGEDVADATGALRRREGTVGRLLATDVLAVESEKLLVKARESLANLDSVTKSLTGSVELVANRLDQAGASVEGLRTVVENTKKITGELAELTSGVNRGRGSIGKLMTDDSVFVEAKGLLKELRESIQDLREQAPINSFIGVVFSAF